MESTANVMTGSSLTYQIANNLSLSMDVRILLMPIHQAIQYCKKNSFADDTNIFHISKSVNKPNKLVNRDIKSLKNLLSGNNIYLNLVKTELVT